MTHSTTLPRAGSDLSRSPCQESRLLQRLPPDDCARLAVHLKPFTVPTGYVLHGPGVLSRYVYFPVQGACAALSITESGDAVEAGLIGPEGVTSVVALATTGGPMRVVAELGAMQALRLSVPVFEQEMDRHEALWQVVTGFYHTFFDGLVRTVACGRLHSLEERCGRLLLSISDRVGASTFAVTHEALAMMLGAHRPALSAIAERLHDRGLIAYHRGIVTIIDRASLTETACECYRRASEGSEG